MPRLGKAKTWKNCMNQLKTGGNHKKCCFQLWFCSSLCQQLKLWIFPPVTLTLVSGQCGCTGAAGTARLALHRWKFCKLGLEVATLPRVSSNSCFGNTALSLSIEIILCNVAGKGLICLLREKRERGRGCREQQAAAHPSWGAPVDYSSAGEEKKIFREYL